MSESDVAAVTYDAHRREVIVVYAAGLFQV